MSFQPADGNWTSKYLPSKASTAYVPGELLQNDGTDNITATTSSTKHVGIIDQAKSASDATTSKIKVLVPRTPTAKMYGDVGSGTPAVANVGKQCDLAAGGTVAWGTNTHHQLTIEGYISATRGLFSINSLSETSDAS